MHVHPAIAALRSDPASQRQSNAAMDAAVALWNGHGSVAAIRRELDLFARGHELAQLPALASLMSDHAQTLSFVEQFCEEFLRVLRQEPLGEVPMRHRSSAGFARLQLMQGQASHSGSAAISLSVYEPLAISPAPEAALFSDCESHEMVVAGSASGFLYWLESGEVGASIIAPRACRWRSGDTIATRARHETRQICAVDRSFLVLQLSRTPIHALPSREYRVSDGALLRQTSGNKRASQHVLALAVLGALEHREAIGVMRLYAADQAHDPDARWESVRQVLALDTAGGLALLSALSNAGDDPLSKPARDLRDDLLAAHPALRTRLKEPA